MLSPRLVGYGWCGEELIRFEKTEEGMKEGMKEKLEHEVQRGQRSVCSCGKVAGVGAILKSCKQGKEQIQKSIRPKETAEQKKNAMESTEKEHSGRKKD